MMIYELVAGSKERKGEMRYAICDMRDAKKQGAGSREVLMIIYYL